MSSRSRRRRRDRRALLAGPAAGTAELGRQAEHPGRDARRQRHYRARDDHRTAGHQIPGAPGGLGRQPGPRQHGRIRRLIRALIPDAVPGELELRTGHDRSGDLRTQLEPAASRQIKRDTVPT